jgi:hypothetical protein
MFSDLLVTQFPCIQSINSRVVFLMSVIGGHLESVELGVGDMRANGRLCLGPLVGVNVVHIRSVSPAISSGTAETHVVHCG